MLTLCLGGDWKLIIAYLTINNSTKNINLLVCLFFCFFCKSKMIQCKIYFKMPNIYLLFAIFAKYFMHKIFVKISKSASLYANKPML